MRLLVGTQPLGRILKWAQRALVACAVLLLGYCGFALGDAWVFQWRESRDLDRLLRVERLASKGTAQAQSFVSPKGLIGRVEIPRLFFSQVVVEGIDRTTLRRVIGHIPGTALPGEAGGLLMLAEIALAGLAIAWTLAASLYGFLRLISGHPVGRVSGPQTSSR